MTAADFIPGPEITHVGYLRDWLTHEEAVYVNGHFMPTELLNPDPSGFLRGETHICAALRRTQPQTLQQEIDEALAKAQTEVDHARKVCTKNGRIGLRQHAALLAGELDETRAQTARCYERGNIEVEG